MPALNEFQEQIQAALANPSVGLPLALALAGLAGLLLALTPSVLAMAPVVIGFVAAEPGLRRWRAAVRSFAFVLGTATTFAAFGLLGGWIGSYLGPLFGANGYLIAGLVLILLGAVLIVRLQFRLPMLAAPERQVHSVFGAYGLGLPFGLVGST